MSPLRLTESPGTISPINRTVTQEDIDKEDEERRKEALRDLIESWMDRLQLISVITTFFVSIEASLLTITTPSDATAADSVIFQLCNISLMGALLIHSSAAIVSFLAAFFLIRHKLKVARQEEVEALIKHQENSDASSGNQPQENNNKEKEPPSDLPPLQNADHSRVNAASHVRFVASRNTDPVPGPIRVPSSFHSADGRPLFSRNPHLSFSFVIHHVILAGLCARDIRDVAVFVVKATAQPSVFVPEHEHGDDESHIYATERYGLIQA
ncbi:hypothetical protein CVT24_003790 [Panaeolus cyanescens]|uniref:Transmembrane protein n=1 Tax=Panaeolus cyanescens TaxID=181874 RepID=A0A409W859_9AGAR|nr:hypothetical protein CVT24_003790 [Panaeolus cyanescens]